MLFSNKGRALLIKHAAVESVADTHQCSFFSFLLDLIESFPKKSWKRNNVAGFLDVGPFTSQVPRDRR